MIVMKFGGSSVADAERIMNMTEIVKSRIKYKPVLVLSAMGDTTDCLLESAEAALKKGFVSIEKIEELHLKTMSDLFQGSAQEPSAFGAALQKEVKTLFWELGSLLTGISLTRELTGRTKDCLVSFGERFSVRIAAAYLASQKINAKAIDAWDAGFISDSAFGQAELRKESYVRIGSTLRTLTAGGVLPVITGFIAKDEGGNITTLGRGGSDLSATVIAAACKAEEVQVWKDVDGILTADPRVVDDARPVELISYDEAAELAYFGAQVLHPRAMQPCIKTGIPVLVKNSFNPQAPGTRITPGPVKNTSLIRAITSKKNVTLVDIVSTRMLGQSGFLARVFSEFAKNGISVDMIATSEVSVSLTLDAQMDLAAVCRELSQYAEVEVKTGKAIVTIVGDVYRSSEILHEAFGVCRKLGFQVQMVSQGASKVNISFIVNNNEAETIVKELHRFFFSAPAGVKPAAKKTDRAK
ncbi:MAG: aspartate kinase [Spirochaetaceae bacterium]|jgi:aspartate kinase|nr:aspartate kinase [Spirochaetaceae bacterium]